MMTILEHVSLAQLRACKSRDGLHRAIERTLNRPKDIPLLRPLQTAVATNITLITQLDHILNQLDRPPGPCQP